MNSKLQKCFIGRDRLSEMPDDVIVNILSFMPTVDAVRTVLLRRFGNLWTFIPNLDLEIDEWELDDDRFALCIHNVLMLHKSPIDRFVIYFESECEKLDLKALLRIVLDRQSKYVPFRSCGHKHFVVPNLTSQHLVKLELTLCGIDLPLQVNLGSLKVLLLYDVSMCEEAFQQFLSGCPSLQTLDIMNPDGLIKLSFSFVNIHQLRFHATNGYVDHPWLLDFPNLKTLVLELWRVPNIIDVSSVRVIKVEDLGGLFDFKNLDERAMIQVFLGKFEGAEVFQLLSDAEQFLHSLFPEDLHLLRSTWKRIILWISHLSGEVCERCLVGISVLLRSLKDLEELVFTGSMDTKVLKRILSFQRASPNAKVHCSTSRMEVAMFNYI